MLVKITNLRGETGLRQPGTLYLVGDELGKIWIEKGWAIEVKEEKAAIEIKEEKFEVKTKETKRKRVVKVKK
jgi:regulator of RNase E activity RraA